MPEKEPEIRPLHGKTADARLDEAQVFCAPLLGEGTVYDFIAERRRKALEEVDPVVADALDLTTVAAPKPVTPKTPDKSYTSPHRHTPQGGLYGFYGLGQSPIH